ncbi:MAG: hypothetical protein AB7E55_01200 [Pigmentiphaga sp.]
MADATVTIRRWTGPAAGPTKTDITSSTTRASTSDDPNPGTSNPIPIPTSGSKRSYWVSTQLSVDANPDAHTIDNLQWYTDGSNGFGTGVSCVGNTASAYVQATGTPGDTGDELNTANHANLAGAPVNVFTYTSASPKSVTGSMAGGTGDLGHQFVFQLVVSSEASLGITPSEQFVWQYDES